MTEGPQEICEAWKGVLGLMRSGREFLSDENNWCQRHARHPDGHRRSILGAVGNILSEAESPWTRAATQLLAIAVGKGDGPYDGGWVQHFNDTHTHAEVLALMDRTIAAAEREAAIAARGPRAWRVVADRWVLI